MLKNNNLIPHGFSEIQDRYEYDETNSGVNLPESFQKSSTITYLSIFSTCFFGKLPIQSECLAPTFLKIQVGRKIITDKYMPFGSSMNLKINDATLLQFPVTISSSSTLTLTNRLLLFYLLQFNLPPHTTS